MRKLKKIIDCITYLSWEYRLRRLYDLKLKNKLKNLDCEKEAERIVREVFGEESDANIDKHKNM